MLLQMIASRRLTGGDVETHRRQQVGHAGLGAEGGNARQRLDIDIGGQPRHGRQSFGKECGMLAAAAGHFQHQCSRRQEALEHRKDRLAVARYMRVVELRIGRFQH
jgi:hypothetical protein